MNLAHRAHNFAQYTAAGAASGALFTGVGATILHVPAPDTFGRVGAVAAGAIGGAVTHLVYGALSAVDGEPGMGARLRGIGRSLPIAALTSGVLGGAILGLSGHLRPPTSEALLLSGALGGALVGTAGLVGTVAAKLMCVARPGWVRLASGDLGTGERLMGPPPAVKHHWWQRRRAPTAVPHHAAAPPHAHTEAAATAEP